MCLYKGLTFNKLEKSFLKHIYFDSFSIDEMDQTNLIKTL